MNSRHSLLKQPRRSRVAIGVSSWRGSSRRLEKEDSDTLKRNYDGIGAQFAKARVNWKAELALRTTLQPAAVNAPKNTCQTY
ncbi:hypothetical protein CW714_10145 [Methanophagales archaeon]|nr:MAG: hypothetical protein CW714_10145 [Methanophagales archaeon]